MKYAGDNIISEYKTIGVLVNGTGTLTPLTLAKRYINSIGTDAVIGYDAEEQISPTSTGITTTRYQYHKNQLGSIIALTKGPRTLIQKYSYDSYGKAYVYSGTTLIPISSYTGNTYSNTRLYTGREYDKETNLYYLRARYYSSDTGRFLQRDPVGQSDQVNLYTYVRNSPLGYTDRDGRIAKQLATSYRSFIRNDLQNSDNWEDRVSGKTADFFLGDGLDLFLDHDKMSGVELGVQTLSVLGVGKILKRVKKIEPPDFIVSPNGTVFPVPKNAVGPVPNINNAGNTTGVKFINGEGGANGQVSTMRIMDPTLPNGKSPGYPNGYIKYENSNPNGIQAVNPYTGKPGSKPDTHFPIN